jgi:uncharacterized protein YjiS (DUF1127 family)
MAFYNDTQRAQSDVTVWGWLADIRADLSERATKYRLYRETLNELNALTDRDLYDLGLHRAILADVAREAAYKA